METGVFVMIVFVSLGSFAMIATIVWLGVHAKNRKATLQAEVQTRLIDKFSNAPEFVDFLNSDTGKQFLTGIDKMPKLMARDMIVGGVSRGLILTLLGAAFIASLFWMLALTKLPLSHAYPFMAVTFVLVVLGGAWFFAEPLSTQRIVALVLIGAGVVISGLS